MYDAPWKDLRLDPAHGCALGGCIAFSCSIEGALPIVHGTVGCAGGYRMVMLLCDREPLLPTTSVYDYELAMGTANKLEAALYKAKRIYNPAIIFVLLTCATSLAGEDYTRLAKRFGADTHTKVFLLDGSAFGGEDTEGYIAAYRAFTDWLDVKHPGKSPYVALDGISPEIYAAKEQFIQLKKIVEEHCGLKLAPSISLTFNPEKDRDAYAAAVVMHLGRLWQEEERIFKAPIGTASTMEFIEGVCKRAGCEVPEKTAERAAYYYNEEEKLAAGLRPFLKGKYALVEADGFYALPLAGFLREKLGMKLVVSTDESGTKALQNTGFCDWLWTDMGGWELNEERKRLSCIMSFGSSNVYAHDDDECLYIPFTAPCWDEVGEKRSFLDFDGTLELLNILKEHFCRGVQ